MHDWEMLAAQPAIKYLAEHGPNWMLTGIAFLVVMLTAAYFFASLAEMAARRRHRNRHHFSD